MTSPSVDIVSACVEDIVSRLSRLSFLGTKRVFYAFTEDQIEDLQSRAAPPLVIITWGGLGAASRSYRNVFSLYFLAKSETLSQVRGSLALPKATSQLQSIRYAMLCSKAPTGNAWVLDYEVPNGNSSDAIMYRMNWHTTYHPISGLPDAV